ncbi:TnsD family Tn7-like transposition protein [Glaciecola sp. MF2-115]|uniref:TnsD family Tn7-like transposition protein n=1 Tax=Glaciecola sp. MF2-115 TaxID=3384827 RepID=UPI0039A0BBF8
MELLQYAPRRYRDETVYSMAARLVLHDISISMSRSSQNVFQNKNLQLDSALPSFLPLLAEKMQCSCDELLQQHSLFPYYSMFANKRARQRALSTLLRGDSSGAFKALGLLANRLADESHLKYCPMCANNQKFAYGETYWLRAHQLPLVSVCAEHKCKLIRVPRRRKHLLFPEHSKPIDYKFDAVAMKIADISRDLLNSSNFDNGKLLKGYAARLVGRRLATTKSINLSKWFTEMSEYFVSLKAKDERVSQLLSEQSEHGFPANVFYSGNSSHHPIKHVLIITFLFEHFGDFVVNYSNTSTIVDNQNLPELPKQSDIDKAKHNKVKQYLNQNLSLRQIVKRANASAATVRNIAKRQGVQLTSMKRQVDHTTERLITIKLMVGLPTERISLQLGVSISDVEQVLSGQPEIKFLRRRIRNYRKRQQSRDNLLVTIGDLKHLRVKEVKKKCYADYMWLYKNDNAWLFNTLRSHSFPVKI